MPSPILEPAPLDAPGYRPLEPTTTAHAASVAPRAAGAMPSPGVRPVARELVLLKASEPGDALPDPTEAAALEALEAAKGAAQELEGATPGTAEAGPRQAERRVVVRRGDTLLDILARVGISGSEAHEAITSVRDVFDPRRLRPGQAVELAVDSQGVDGEPRLAALSMNVDVGNDLRLTRDESGGFLAETIERELQRSRVFAGGRIDGSLFASGRQLGLPADALAQLVKVFSWDVDFQRDLQPMDQFEAVVERTTDEAGNPAGPSRLVYAALKLGDKLLAAYRYERADGSSEYYDATGRPLKKWLLRTPVDGARLSSTFGPRRHPILGYARMHKGIDFAAPAGTPIFAAGDGRIEFLGVNRGYGNYVRIAHNAQYSTAYAHMSRFAAGLGNGDRVRQGQVIGYVGSSGLSTGPHLHYEMFRAGTQINPLSVKTVDQARLAGKDLKRFDILMADIEALRRTSGKAGAVVASRADAVIQR